MMILSSALVVGCFGAADPSLQPSLLGAGEVNDMVRFGAALCLARGSTNKWDIHGAGPRTGWKSRLYVKINEDERILRMHQSGSALVHNYMETKAETTSLYNYARMSPAKFNECMKVVVPAFKWINMNQQSICQAYPDGIAVQEHWTRYIQMRQEWVVESFEKSQPYTGTRKLPLPQRLRASMGGDSEACNEGQFMTRRSSKKAWEQGQQQVYSLEVTGEVKARLGRLAVLTYLSRGLCDYFNNYRSPLDRIVPFQPGENGNWLTNRNRRGSQLDTVIMRNIADLGNIIAHQKSQQDGVGLDEYSFLICHLEDKITTVIDTRRSATSLDVTRLPLRNVNGHSVMTDPFNERLQFIERLKNDADLQLLRPYEKPGRAGAARFLTLDDFTSRRNGPVYVDEAAGIDYRQKQFHWRWPQGKDPRN